MMSISVLKDNKNGIVLMPKAEASCLGALLDACLDTVGCVEPSDIGVTVRQLSKAEDNMIALSTALLEA